MIKRMLDTNICIHIAQKKPQEVIRRFSEYRKGEIAISAITWTEMCCGTSSSGEPALHRLLDLWEVMPFTREAAQIYAILTGAHPRRKAGFDRLIAAHAIAAGIPLVSNNTADFALYRQNGLRLENWCVEPDG